MSRNPELQRNLWLQLSWQRLLAAPIILGAVIFLAWIGSDHSVFVVRKTALGLFYFIVCVWGTRRAAESIAEELAGGTWDGQRMSSLGAWSMAWGKLVGATSFVWYAGVLCLAVVAAMGFKAEMPAPAIAIGLVRLVCTGLIGQAVALAAALMFLRKLPGGRRLQVNFSHALGVLAAVIGPAGDAGPAWLLRVGRGVESVAWYGFELDPSGFAMASLVVFLAWALVAAYRLMRVELQFRSQPWVWPLFVLFLMLYAEGFLYHLMVGLEARAAWLMAPLAVAIALVYVAAFTAPKDVVRHRWFVAALRQGRWRRAGELMPLWLPTYVIAAAAGAAAIALGGGTPIHMPVLPVRFDATIAPSAPLVLALLLFVLRDLCLILLLNFGERRQRADLAAFIYLLLLYGPMAAIAAVLGLGKVEPFFVPYDTGNPALTVGPVMLETVVVLVLLSHRWAAAGRSVRPRPAVA